MAVTHTSSQPAEMLNSSSLAVHCHVAFSFANQLHVYHTHQLAIF